MEKKLITQLKILKLSNVKPNFAELARIYALYFTFLLAVIEPIV